MARQDRQGSRTPAELERKYGFEKRFDDAMEAAASASKSVVELDKKLSQTEVFNRLTNNGKSQGVFMDDNGQLYLNASFLSTGILRSRDGKTFYLDLVNGILKGQFSEFTIAGKTVNSLADTAQKNAEEYADNAVNSQTQTDVFNKLTNNGAAEGLFYVDGQLYINASYLTTGILKSLDETTFYLDLVNGILRGAFESLSIAGKAVSWKDNGDGTYTLIGTDPEQTETE